MHLVEHMELPGGYRARPYRGLDDVPAIHAVLVAYREHIGDPERPTLDQMINTYTHLGDCDPDRDIAVVETLAGEAIGYCRPTAEQIASGGYDLVVFQPLAPAHLAEPLYTALVAGQERHLLALADAEASADTIDTDVDRSADTQSRQRTFRAYAVHPGPDAEAIGEAAWLERSAYAAAHWGAALRRPHLDDVPELALPDGVEVRAVLPEQRRHIWEVYHEAFRGEWGFTETSAEDIDRDLAEPTMDHTLWQVAWEGDQVVGQVKPFINAEENELRGYRRGYTEYIATHRDWRNRGIAKALLARALLAIRERGMTEAVLGVDTNNPGGAFQLYTSLGFELVAYEAIYEKRAG